jgi:hypothetical protein
LAQETLQSPARWPDKDLGRRPKTRFDAALIDVKREQSALTLDVNWRALVLFGRNLASYSVALARTLLEPADHPDDCVPVDNRTAPVAW